MKSIDVEQGSYEWLQMHIAKISGTRLKAVLSKKDIPMLVYEMIAEKVTGEVEYDDYVSPAMQWGKDNEPLAREKYCEAKGIEIFQHGFCLCDAIDFMAVSPDGYTDCLTGGIEIKCPTTKVHVKYIHTNVVPPEYMPQVLCNFIVNEKLKWLDFVSFDPRFLIKPLHVVRVFRDDLIKPILEAEVKAKEFYSNFQKIYDEITF